MNRRVGRLVDTVVTKGKKALADEASKAEAIELFQKCLEERREELSLGPFSKAQLDRKFGKGKWWAMMRYAIMQNGRMRMIDNAKSSGHSSATCTEETICPCGIEAQRSWRSNLLTRPSCGGCRFPRLESVAMM
jgi:hypothetical protein